MPRHLCAAVLAAALLCPWPAAAAGAARTARAPRPGRTAHAAPSTQPGPAWLKALGHALPELGLDAGLDTEGPRINDYGDSGIRVARAALVTAARAVRGDTPDARLIRTRLRRESLAWNELDFLSHRPGAFVPNEALLSVLNVQSVPFDRRLDWAAARMELGSLRLGEGLIHAYATSPELAAGGATDAATAKRTIRRVGEYADSLGLEPALSARLKGAAADARGMADRFEDFLNHDVLPVAKGDPRPDTAAYATMLREGYALEGSPAGLEARLTAALAAARRETDSLGALLDPAQPATALLEVLKGNHPPPAELIPSVTAVFRHAEDFGRTRWPGLPAAPLDVGPLDFGYRLQGQVSAYFRPRPLRAALEEPGFGVALVDTDWPTSVQETFLKQLCVYYDSVLAARQDLPGETMLWRVHIQSPGERLWAAGPHTFLAWGLFAQHLGARAGTFTSPESRLFESWSRLTWLARAAADVRLGRRRTDPGPATTEINRATGIELTQCQGYVKEALENPGRQAAVALRALEYERCLEGLLARGTAEPAALKKLAETALFNPADQARLLGLAP